MGQMSLRFATEVRHSLHSMLGFLELAVEEPLSDRQLVYLAQCRTGADRLLRVASDLWELSQPESPPHPCSAFQVEDAVSEVVDLTRIFASRKGLDLECVFPAGSQGRIQGPRGLIQDTLRRLLDNAVKFTERGRIRASAGVRGEGEAAVLELEVADTGNGLPQEVLAALRSTDNMLPEQGLSLPVVKRRMARMNGELSVVSSSAAGTIVRLAIPVRLEPQEPPTEGTRVEDSGSPLLRILVAEDSDDSYFVFQSFVGDACHKLTRAYNGSQAIEMAQTGEYDLIVMDANMPLLDGYSATRTIREWESTAGRSERMPILLFSADDPLTQVKLGSAAGCSGYLAKPATKAEILKALKFFAPRQTTLS